MRCLPTLSHNCHADCSDVDAFFPEQGGLVLLSPTNSRVRERERDGAPLRPPGQSPSSKSRLANAPRRRSSQKGRISRADHAEATRLPFLSGPWADSRLRRLTHPSLRRSVAQEYRHWNKSIAGACQHGRPSRGLLLPKSLQNEFYSTPSTSKGQPRRQRTLCLAVSNRSSP